MIVICFISFALTVGVSYFLFKVFRSWCKSSVYRLENDLFSRICLVLEICCVHFPFDIIYSCFDLARIIFTAIISDYCYIFVWDIHVIRINRDRCVSYICGLRYIIFLSNNSIDLDIQFFCYYKLVFFSFYPGIPLHDMLLIFLVYTFVF